VLKSERDNIENLSGGYVAWFYLILSQESLGGAQKTNKNINENFLVTHPYFVRIRIEEEVAPITDGEAKILCR